MGALGKRAMVIQIKTPDGEKTMPKPWLMINLVRDGLQYYRQHWRLLLCTALAYFGLMFGAGVLVILMPSGHELQESLEAQVMAGFEEVFPWLLTAPPALAVVYILLVNLVLGTMLYITLPGAILFPLAPLAAFFRAIMWGIFFAPTEPLALLVALPTILAEGLGYVLAVVPSLRLGLSWLLPRSAFKQEQLSRRVAFRRGLSELGRAYLIVIIVLLVAAVIESLGIAVRA